MGFGRFIAFFAMMGLLAVGMMSGGPISMFIALPSMILVLGTTVCGTFASFPGGRVLEALGSAGSAEAAQRKAAVFHRMADLAVASGLVGTLVGLVQMLRNLDDPSAIGPAMAVALLTLLYGTVLGELVLRGLTTSTVDASGGSSAERGRHGAVSV